jgi:23S rRNA pseudouridine955/2504/2580 synthase
LQAFADCSYVEAELFTGRTHQIRVHAAHLGLPLAGDTRYGDAKMMRLWKSRGLNRLFLHAHHLSFKTMESGTVTCHALLPDALRRVLDQLGG